MRILHAYKIYQPDSFGGVPSAIATLAKLSRPGLDNEILTARNRGLMRSQEIDGIPVKAVSSIGTFLSMPLAPTYPYWLARLARNFDIVVHHAPFPLNDIGIIFIPKKTALVIHWHAETRKHPFLTSLLAPLVRHSLRRADRIVVSDQSLIERSPFLRKFSEKCVIIPFGCDFDYWARLSKPQEFIVTALQQSHPRLIVAVGRLVRYKGFDILLRALQRIDAQTIIIGEGPLKAELKDLATDLGIADRVNFLSGLQSDEVKQYIHAAKVLAFPSVTDAETFGIVQIEAMAAAKPIVNTNLPTAVPNVARHNKEGLTVPPNDPIALRVALHRLLDDPQMAARLGQAGQARARTEYNQALSLRRAEQVYKEIITSKY